MTIRRLSAEIVNKIAAGEVIDRPASCVKELIENSIDAGARRIRIEIDGAGRKLIRVTDDGSGINPAELELAVAPHATSKIGEASDLWRIETLGFRGEALASIAAVGEVKIATKRAIDETGMQLAVKGGKLAAITPVGHPDGTTIEIRNLFFNTPAREKFLKTNQTEFGHIVEAVTRVALSYPQIFFELVNGKQHVFNLPPVDTLAARIEAIFGSGKCENLRSFDFAEDDYVVFGMAEKPAAVKRSRPETYYFVNGRAIRDRTVQHAVKHAYEGMIVGHGNPSVFLFIEMPPNLVDVNVHPSKSEVRFANSQVIHALVRNAIRAAFKTPLTQQGPVAGDWQAAPWNDGARPSHPAPAGPPGTHSPAGELAQAVAKRRAEALQPVFPASGVTSTPPPDGAVDRRPFMQVLNTYVAVSETDGVLLIDQHALHEARIYREFKKSADERVQIQRLLIPEVIDLQPCDVPVFEENLQRLAEMGFEFEHLGDSSFGLSAYPLVFGQIDVTRFVTGLVAEIREERERLSAPDEKLKRAACRAAIMAGQRLKDDEVENLVRMYFGDPENLGHCPHGRPTAVKLDSGALEKLFRRQG